MQRELTTHKAPFGGAPVSVQTAISFALMSGMLVLLDTVLLGVRTGTWKYLIAGFWYLVLVFWLIDQLIKLKRWAWWLTVVLSGLFSIKTAMAVLAWLVMREKASGADPQSLAFQVLCCLALGMVFWELVVPTSREAFGIHSGRRNSPDSASPLQLDQVAVGVADKNLSQS
jgi:hypothetical protein